jgi:murein L,D-transpeptidase YcbB/YkuD
MALAGVLSVAVGAAQGAEPDPLLSDRSNDPWPQLAASQTDIAAERGLEGRAARLLFHSRDLPHEIMVSAETAQACSNNDAGVAGNRFAQIDAEYWLTANQRTADGNVSDDPAYRRLRDALAFYTALVSSGGWQSLPAGPSLKPDMTHDQVGGLRQRLNLTRDLPAGDQRSTLFDAELEAAVRRFQARNGLVVDGIVGRETRAMLNVPADMRAAAIAQSLCRYPELVAKQRGTSIIVNVPGAELRFFRDGELIFSSRVIVGRTDWPTPLISDAVAAIELNPYWNIPPRIAQQEVIPRIIRNPEYLRTQRIRVLSLGEATPRELDPAQIDWTSVGGGALPFRLRQDPGPQNAMGLVKFRLNNPHHIFLHDTPARNLFDNAKRNLSHGCVRVQGALDLAKLILEARSDLPPNGLEQALEGDAPVVIRLRAPLPVHLVVISAWVDEDGTVNFRNDPTRDTAEKSCIASPNTIAGNN